MSKRREQRKSNRKKRTRRHEGPVAADNASSVPGQQGSAKPTSEPELLAPRILLSATCMDGERGPDRYRRWMAYYEREEIEAIGMGLITMRR